MSTAPLSVILPGHRVRIPALSWEVIMKFSELADQCAKHLAVYRNYSRDTILNYETAAKQFYGYLSEARLHDELRSFNEDTVYAFAQWLATKGVGTNTIRIRLQGLRAIAKFGMKVKDGRGRPAMTMDPTATFEWPVFQKPTTKYLYSAELQAIAAVPLPLGMAVARALLVETGLRASELCKANVGDVVASPQGYVLSVAVKGRGRRAERVDTPLSERMVALIRDWLLQRNMPAPGEPLLLSATGKRWHRNNFGDAIYALGRRAGITRIPVRPHVFRHTANVIFRGSQLDPYVRSRLLHHDSLASQARYDHLVPGELFRARTQAVQGLELYGAGPGFMTNLYGGSPVDTAATARKATDES